MLVCLHICPFLNYYYPEVAWKTVDLLQSLKVKQVFVPKEKMSIGRIEFERGLLPLSRNKLINFIEIYSDKYSLVLSHSAPDLTHFRQNYKTILSNTPSAPKAVFFEEKFAEVSEFIFEMSESFSATQQKKIGLVLNFNNGINAGVNAKTIALLNKFEFDFNVWYLPVIYSGIPEFDNKKMLDFEKVVKDQSIDLIFNDMESLFHVDAYARGKKLDWTCKHIVQLFEIANAT